MTVHVDDIPKLPRHRKPKNQPIDSRWRQQRLAAKRPVLTIQAVFPTVIGLGFIIFGLGLFLYFSVNNSLQFPYDYTDCLTKDGQPAKKLVLLNQKPICQINITLTENYDGDVKFYYQLDGFYQNFRTYFSSRNDLQLDGDLYQTDGCSPLECVFAEGYNKTTAPCTESSYTNQKAFPIVPCGSIANSMFNDTFLLYFIPYNPNSNITEDSIPVPFTSKGVLSNVERRKKFRNPQDRNLTKYPGTGCEQFKNTVKPPNWEKPICELGLYNNTNSINDDDVGWALNNIDLEVWMKTAALPNFRKPYRILDRNASIFFKSGLPAGTYILFVTYNYNVNDFNIKKFFVIARENWIGPRNYFLPIIYMITGCFLLLSIVALWVAAKLKEKFNKEAV